MAKPKKPKSGLIAVSAKIATLDGNRVDIKGEFPSLTAHTALMLLCCDPPTPRQQHAMLELLKSMQVPLPANLRSSIVEQFGVLGEGLLRDFDAKPVERDGPLVAVPTGPVQGPLTHDMERRTWEEFRTAGLLWAVNTILHWFGWAIVAVTDDSAPDKVIGVYPVRTKWRGFSLSINDIGVQRLTAWMASAGGSLAEDIAEDYAAEEIVEGKEDGRQ